MGYALAINAGSSSIKFKLFEQVTMKQVLFGSAKNVESEGGKLTISHIKDFSGLSRQREGMGEGDELEREEKAIPTETKYEEVFQMILESITLILGDLSQVEFVAHRIVHGGNATSPIVIRHHNKKEKGMLDYMASIESFAPLHNYHSMLIIAPQKYTYALPPSKKSTSMPLRQYGFHGLSYGSVLDQMASYLKKPPGEISLVVAHLGSGSSVCCIRNGESIDTSMGLTPLQGLSGGTRSGSVDPALIFHHTENASELIQVEGNHLISRGEYILNKNSGFKALTGTSDFGAIIARSEHEKEAKECYDMFVGRVESFVISYVSQLLADGGHIDGIVFAGGIGENADRLRADVMKSLNWIERLGKSTAEIGGIDAKANEGATGAGGVVNITLESSRIKAYVVVTDEERMCVKLAQEVV